jgi:hypothetical protein
MMASNGPDRLTDRVIIRCFPRSWRLDGRAAEALGIAWDTADDEGREVLGVREGIDLSWLGLRSRVDAAARLLSAPVRHVVAALAVLGGVGLATCLLVISIWTPVAIDGDPASVSPLASTGTAIWVSWVVSGLLTAVGRELIARLSFAFAFALTIAVTVFALGVRPLAGGTRAARWTLAVGSICVGAVLGLLSRVATQTWPASSVYYGNVLVLSTIAEIVLWALAVGGLLCLESPRGRAVVVALLISAGPWLPLAARASSDQGHSAHINIVSGLSI